MGKHETRDTAAGSPTATDPHGDQPDMNNMPDTADQPVTRDADGGSANPASVETLQRERDDYYDRLVRKTAEFDNYRKRIERERRTQSDEATASLLLDLLLIADDFDRALGTEPGEAEAHRRGEAGTYRRGVELIHTKLHDVLRRRGVRPIDALGADFDPNVHEAVSHESSPEHREGEVIDELRRGYMIGDRLLRPAMVKVAKA